MTRIRITTFAVLLLGMAFIPACLELSATNDGSGGGTGTKTDCSQKQPTCNECQVCEGQTEAGRCYKEYQACRDEPSCASFDDCVRQCPAESATCAEACLAMITDTGTTFTNYYFCMYCTACGDSCSGTVPCGA